MDHVFPYKWKIEDQFPSVGIPHHRAKVFSCFACGGGSSFGYKLAGYDVIGCNEIDPRMMKCYVENHHPKYSYLEDIRTFKLRDDLSRRLYHLDILDGSFPCSSYSTSGKRHKHWGKEKIFAEGQAKQVLDTLAFDFVDVAEKLQPKIVIGENVKGLISGRAMDYKTNYISKIHKALDKAGYVSQHFLLEASKMGVPQARERVFIIALRKDLMQYVPVNNNLVNPLPVLNLKFKQNPILFREVFHDYCDKPLVGKRLQLSEHLKEGDHDLNTVSKRVDGITKFFSHRIIYKDAVPLTVVSNDCNILYGEQRQMNFDELCECGSFPKDYNFMGVQPVTLIGMSVPPVFMAQISYQIYLQWLTKINI